MSISRQWFGLDCNFAERLGPQAAELNYPPPVGCAVTLA